jgi:hypothetical protein
MITKAQLIPFSTSVFIWYNNSDQRLCVPFDPDNTDYQNFKKDLAEGASLKDAEGNDMTAEQITTFLGTLT